MDKRTCTRLKGGYTSLKVIRTCNIPLKSLHSSSKRPFYSWVSQKCNHWLFEQRGNSQWKWIYNENVWTPCWVYQYNFYWEFLTVFLNPLCIASLMFVWNYMNVSAILSFSPFCLTNQLSFYMDLWRRQWKIHFFLAWLWLPRWGNVWFSNINGYHIICSWWSTVFMTSKHLPASTWLTWGRLI